MTKKEIFQAMMWDSLSRIHKINNHLASAASEIEDFCVSILDAGKVSEILQKRHGITIWKLRDICDEMHKIEVEEHEKAVKFDKYLSGDTSVVDEPSV